MKHKLRLALLLCLLSVGLALPPAQAHDSRLVLIDLAIDADGGLRAAWRMPATVGTQLIGLDFGPSCESQGPAARGSNEWVQRYRCADDPQTAVLRYSRFAPAIAVLMTVTWPERQVSRQSYPVGSTMLPIPAREQVGSALSGYLTLGFEHILGGWDHLLFVLGLAVLARGWRRLLLVVTGFTIGHSISLSLGALGIVAARMAAVETLIALSLVVLAAELIRPKEASWSWRYPLIMSCGFGLLHGFGFGAALTEIGLPQTTLVPALFAFNVGVELGQLAFLALLGGLWWLLGKLRLARALNPSMLAAYIIGIPAAYWTIARALASFA